MIKTEVEATSDGFLLGTIKFFNQARGFGFIVPEDGGKDVFVHILRFKDIGANAPSDGMLVGYKAIETGRGTQATHVCHVKED